MWTIIRPLYKNTKTYTGTLSFSVWFFVTLYNGPMTAHIQGRNWSPSNIRLLSSVLCVTGNINICFWLIHHGNVSCKDYKSLQRKKTGLKYQLRVFCWKVFVNLKSSDINGQTRQKCYAMQVSPLLYKVLRAFVRAFTNHWNKLYATTNSFPLFFWT